MNNNSIIIDHYTFEKNKYGINNIKNKLRKNIKPFWYTSIYSQIIEMDEPWFNLYCR